MTGRFFSRPDRYTAVVSPSTVGLVATMTSRIPPSRTRDSRLSMRRLAGPTPSIGEITPISTWYRPRYWRVSSMDSRSLGSSTTHSRVRSRSLSAQMPQGTSSV